MFTIEIRDTGKENIDSIIKAIEGISYMDFQPEAINLAESTIDEMVSIIIENKKRPDKGQAKLEDALKTPNIGYSILKNHGGMEIGFIDIDRLLSEAPYYQILNDGGSYVTKRTHLVPLGAWSGVGQWIEGAGNKTWYSKAGTVHRIHGIYFMDKSFSDLERKIDSVITILEGKITDILSS